MQCEIQAHIFGLKALENQKVLSNIVRYKPSMFKLLGGGHGTVANAEGLDTYGGQKFQTGDTVRLRENIFV